MRLSILLCALLVVACRPQGSGSESGAAGAREAVEAFLAGARAQDMQAMSRVFGTERGPLRDQENSRAHEMRMISLMCYFNHRSARIVNETPGETQRSLIVELGRGELTARTTFTTVVGPRGRWYVSNAPVTSLGPFCRAPAGPPGASPSGTR